MSMKRGDITSIYNYFYIVKMAASTVEVAAAILFHPRTLIRAGTKWATAG